MCKDDRIKVSVVCTVYNHEKYLRKCLEGIVSQKTNFRFEVIVHDDCSMDGSQDIIREYAEKYPDIIKPILQTENLYSKHNGSLRRAINPNIQGKYVAICEGDDYWIEPKKLQTQSDFLDVHPDVSLCFHNVLVEEEKKDRNGRILYNHLKEGYFDADTILTKWTVPTCSAFMRSECYLTTPYDKRFIVGDNVMWMNCCAKGKVYCMDRKMGVYRRGLDGWTKKNFGLDKKNSLNNYLRFIDHFETLETYFPTVAQKGFDIRLRDYYSRLFVMTLILNRENTIEQWKKGYGKFGFSFIYDILSTVNIYIKNWKKSKQKK